MPRPTLRDVIDRRLAELRINAFQAARDGGLERNFFNDVLIGKKSGFQARSLDKVAKALRLSVEELEALFAGDTGGVSRRAELEAAPPRIIPGTELVGNRDFPIYAAAQGGEGHLIVNFDAIEVVKRPAILEGVKHAYGLLVTGESMIPAYWPGDMALVHPNLHPARDEDVILYDHPPDGQAEAILKRLLGFTDKHWIIQQWNPAKEWREFRADWPTCHRVVGKYSRR